MMKRIEQFNNWLSQGNRLTWLLFFIFTFVLFLKNTFFHWDAFHSILISSLWRDPLSFYKFHMAKLLMPLFISSFLFISKYRWWTIVMSLLIDIWCVSNLIYFKTYDTFLSVSDILLISNMEGAWSSIIVYFDMYMIFMFLLTAIWIVIYCYCCKIKIRRQWITFTSLLLTIFILAYLNNYFTYNPKFWASTDSAEAARLAAEVEEWNTFANAHGGSEHQWGTSWNNIPFHMIYESASDETSMSMDIEQYIRQQSIISDYIAINIYHVFNKTKAGEIITLSDEDFEVITPLVIKNDMGCAIPTNHLIIILVESMESWALHHSIEGQDVAPYLMKLKEQKHVLYCNRITSQTLGGNSGDGQMIINSGLLPIQNGVACMHYGNNAYPNIAHFYSQSALINPWPKIWNQDTMSVRYGYTQKYEPEHGEWEDEHVMKTTIEFLRKSEKPTCVLAITVSMHAPFNRVRNNKIQTSAPSMLNRYMQCYNYTDSCIESFMEAILHDPILSQSTVVITGDHTIFKSAMLTEFMDYAISQDLSIANCENYCPLIIYSPQIVDNVQIDDVCYQMDVFPTILNLIGCKDYCWRGFGVNLLDKKARHNRVYTEQEAYRISDLIIRSNYFDRYISME